MDVKFNYNAAETPQPVIFEQIFSEVPGGYTTTADGEEHLIGEAVIVKSDKKFYALKGTSTIASASGTVVGLLGTHIAANEGDKLCKVVIGAVVNRNAMPKLPDDFNLPTIIGIPHEAPAH